MQWGGGIKLSSNITLIRYTLRVLVLFVLIALYLSIPGVHDYFQQGIRYLVQHDFEGLRVFILSFGIWAPLTSILLMSLQSLVPLVPGIILTITNAWIFGWQYGALYSWVGALIGAALDFAVARWYGRPAVEVLINPKYIGLMDDFFLKYGVLFVFITRITPVIPFKMVSYGAGLTTISLSQYLLATALGQTPAILLYSILGHNLSHNIRLTLCITLIFVTIAATIYFYREKIHRYFFSRRKN